MPFFTIVVPVYQAHRYLPACIDSVCAQTFSDWELYLVDDGSTDDSADIGDAYAAKDDRIHMIRRPSLGTILTRREGIERAAGKYILQLDSDDCYKKETLETLYERIIQTEPDLILFSYEQIDENGQVLQQKQIPQECLTETDRELIYAKLIEQGMFNQVWNKVVRRELLQQPLQMTERQLEVLQGDDAMCMTPVLCKVEKIEFEPKVLYQYRLSSQSITHVFKEKRIDDMLLARKTAVACLQEYGLYQGRIRSALGYSFFRYATNLAVDCVRSNLSLKDKKRICRKILTEKLYQDSLAYRSYAGWNLLRCLGVKCFLHGQFSMFTACEKLTLFLKRR